MATITTGIQLADNFSAPLMHIVSAVNMTISAMDDMNQSMNAGVNTASLSAARNEIAQAAAGFEQMEENIRSASAQQENLNSSMRAGESTASNLAQKVVGMVGAYVSIHSVVSAIKDVLSAEDTQIEAETKLTTVMQQRMGATDQMVQSVKDLTAAQQGLGVVGDEVQMAGAQQMATFLNNSDALKTLIPAMNNLAVQQNGVAVSGESMRNIANMMGKAMQGQVSALTRVGITMTDAEQKALKNGNEMERAAMLAQIITNNVGNMNEAIASTPQGMMQQMSNTWGDMKEVVGGQLYPAVYNLFSTIMANQPAIESALSGVASGLSLVINVLADVVSGAAQAGSFVADNWSIISPVIYGVVAALAVYATYVGITNAIDLVSKGIKIASCLASYAHAAATGTEASATAIATAKQYAFNTALLACPITWIVVAIIAIIASIYLIVAAINKLEGTSISATGVIFGAFTTVGAVIGNVFVTLINFVIDIFVILWNFIANFANFFANVFNDPVGSIARLFFGLVDTILSLLQTVASAIDTIFGSKLADSVSGWRDSLGGWVDNKFGKGTEVMEKVDASAYHVDRFKYSSAYNAGYDFGKGIDAKVSSFSTSKIFGNKGIPNSASYSNALAPNNAAATAATAANTADTAKNTAKTANTLSASSEDLKYLRDIADREYVNKFTTAQIKVEMINHNNVNNDMDLDGMAEHLRSKIEEEMNAAAEGEH